MPTSIAFIMDGNRRWATANGILKLAGYDRAFQVVKDITMELINSSIKYATFFVFSVENWDRPPKEIEYLMNLIESAFKEKDFLFDNGIRLKIIGDRSRLRDDLSKYMLELEKETKNNTRFTLILAIGYSGRDEILRAAKKIVSDVTEQKINLDEINEGIFSGYLDTAGIPYPDIIVRTSEMRLSNFLIWQMAYSELFFLKKYWPDFNKEDLKGIIKEFSQRKRRYGR